MKKLWSKYFDRYIHIWHGWGSEYTGIGYKMGKGFDIRAKRFQIGNPHWFTLMTDFKIIVSHD